MEMEENSEPEEGEAWSYRDDDDNNIDPDISLSYIDEKIQNVLGHLQKDFEGGVSAENLGAKFGGYGSFLPAYERSPSIWSRPQSPQRGSGTLTTLNNLPVEGLSQSLKGPSSVPPSVRLGTTRNCAKELHNSGLASGDVSVACKSTLKDEKSNKLCNRSNQKTLKFRLKVGSDNIARKNAAIYSGLGLDNSPSSSLGNSAEESGGVPVLQEVVDESPSSILQVMTSFPVPESALISPLHESLLCLMIKERLSGYSKPGSPYKGSQGHSALLGDEPVSFLGNGKSSKKKDAKLLRKNEKAKLKHKSGTSFENDLKFSFRKSLGNDIPDTKDIVSNTVDIGDLTKTTDEMHKVSKKTTNNRVRDRLFYSDLVKEDSLESISGQDSGRTGRKNAESGLLENFLEHRQINCAEDVLVEPRDNGRSKSNINFSPSKTNSDSSKCEKDLDFESVAPSKHKIKQQAPFYGEDESTMPHKKQEPLYEGKKKSKGIESRRKTTTVSTKESLKVDSGVAPKEVINPSYDVSTSRYKMHKLKSRKDVNKVKDNHMDSSDTKLEQTNKQIVLSVRHGDGAKDPCLDDREIEQNLSFDKSKERSSGKGANNQLVSDESVKDSANVRGCVADNVLATGVVPGPIAPVVIEENWVCCDSCQKWRLLPFGIKPDQLPEKWLCSMLNWLPGMNRCDINEEETTKALNALYLPAVAGGQNNLQNHVNETAPGVSSVHIQHLDQNHQNLDSHAVLSWGKKKLGLKEISKADSSHGLVMSNRAKNQMQDSVKSKSLNDVNLPTPEPNLIKRSSFQRSSHDLVAQKHMHKQKEAQINEADAMQIKKKNKRGVDQDGYGTFKKPKTEDTNRAGKHQNLGSVSSKSGLSTKVHGKNMQRSNVYSFSEDVKCNSKGRLLVSAKHEVDEVQVSSDDRFLDRRTVDKRDASLKKRKLKEWQDNEIGLDSCIHAEERNGGGLKNEKKFRASKSVSKELSAKSADHNLNKKGRLAQVLLTGSKDHLVDSIEEVRNIDEDHQPWKHRRKFTSEQTLDGVDALRKEFGSGQVSVTATSSSSKVSGSRKTRATFEDVKGSPVESVSSSPMRTSFLEKPTSAGQVFQGRDDTLNGGLPVVSEQRGFWDRDGDSQTKQAEAASEDKVSGGSHHEPVKPFPLNCEDGDTNHKISGKSNPFDLFIGDQDGIGKNHREDVVFPQRLGNVSSLQLKDNDRNCASDFDGDKMRVSDQVNGQGKLFSEESARYESDVDPKSQKSFHKRINNVKHSISDKSTTKPRKDEKDRVKRNDSLGQCLTDSRMENQVKLAEQDHPDSKLVVLSTTNLKAVHQQKLIQDLKDENKAYLLRKESTSGAVKLSSHHEGEGKRESQSCRSVTSSQQGAYDWLPIHGSSNGDVSKALKHPGNAVNSNGVCQSLGHHTPDQKGARNLSSSSPIRKNSSSQTAANALKEAKDLREYADRLKSSSFGFESNEAYFQAALKFLHGASLLETGVGDDGRHGEMTQMQVYTTTAKLCECCALEYEKRREMAAAALAYKCMEIAYWRVVYCKNSCLSRDRNELQSSLQMIPQGESPSSSASDVDNLNNQATIDKGSLSKSAIFHVAGNPISVARNHSSFLRLLDFTQDVNFAMEASRKSQNAFSAANVALEEAQNRECITSVKRVIDFSFQDVEGLVRLVQAAMEAISRSGIGSTRD